MKLIIRIKGQVGLKKEIIETLYRLRLRKKYSCIVIDKPTKIQLGMINKVRDFVAFGEISEEVYKRLVEKRKTKIKNFFRLHPPRGGIESKKHFGVGKGVLGNNGKEINKLVERML
ncbi:MAG: uL30 family ribosomal protein [Nanoarchaeota archaeon]|nr:uL30 family ribosomal protein [Nanoarchaeota archaeon]MBU1028293.1 uL30 family ribosomal protein [Nanoarchaeota archaeon]